MRITVSLQRARDWADLGVKLLTMVAILVGGYWAYYKFRVTDEAEISAVVAVSAEVLPYSRESCLLLLHVRPKNIGNVPISFGNKGFVVTVRSVPAGSNPGALDLDAQPKFYETDILQRFPDGYDLEPRADYDELVALVVPKGSMFSAKAVLNLPDGTEVDHTAVVRAD
jgi:hypothetical protein